MDVRRFRHHARGDTRYVAWQVGGIFDPAPHWLHGLVAAEKARFVDEGLSVQTITGVWRVVPEGCWVVYQEGGNVWEMNDDAFQNLYREVV